MNVALHVMAYMVGGLVFRKNVDVVLTSDVSCFHRTFGIELKLEYEGILFVEDYRKQKIKASSMMG